VGDALGGGASRGAAEGVSGGGEAWLDVLHPVLYPVPHARRHPRAAPGCPRFGSDTVFERPAKCEADERDAVAPGLHVPRQGAHRVVWWDPHTLDLDREPEAGLRQQRILQADMTGLSDTGERAHEAFQAERQKALQDGSLPSIRVRGMAAISKEIARRAALDPAAQDLARAPVADNPVAFELTAINRRARPRGKRFGTLVHAVLAEIDLAAGRASVAVAAEAQGRLLAAAPDEIDAAVDSVLAALDHPTLARAAACAAAGECVRESPVLLTLPDGTVAEGAVDLAFRERVGDVGVWTVVDFKTDIDPALARLRYEAQLRLYMDAITAATGERARGVVLGV
jgi:ATP-dependent exoDNAse (exonuclease V) beta subunit